MSKPHIPAQTAQKLFKLNSLMRRLPDYLQSASYLNGSKHQKAWSDYGYVRAISFSMYKDMYDRIGACRNGCDTWIDNCWITPPVVSIGEDDHERAGSELIFDEYEKRVGLFHALKEADRMQFPAHYSGVIVRVSDGLAPDKPLTKVSLNEIRQLIPVWEGQLIPASFDTNRNSDRYGLPETYNYNSRSVENSPEQMDGVVSDTIHWTRVWIFNEGATGQSIYGTSGIEPSFNALMDWEKMRGSGGEGAWRAAAQRFVMTAKENMQRPSDKVLDELSETLTEMFKSFDTVPYIGGSELQSLNNNMPNVEHYLEATRQDIAAGFKLSTKGIFGSQEGVLAGDQDTSSDARKFQSRRENYLKRQIEQVINWHLMFTDLPDEDWQVSWDDLAAPSMKQKLENVEIMARINQAMALYGGVFPESEMRIEAGFDAKPKGEAEEPLFNDGDDE